MTAGSVERVACDALFLCLALESWASATAVLPDRWVGQKLGDNGPTKPTANGGGDVGHSDFLPYCLCMVFGDGRVDVGEAG